MHSLSCRRYPAQSVISSIGTGKSRNKFKTAGPLWIFEKTLTKLQPMLRYPSEGKEVERISPLYPATQLARDIITPETPPPPSPSHEISNKAMGPSKRGTKDEIEYAFNWVQLWISSSLFQIVCLSFHSILNYTVSISQPKSKQSLLPIIELPFNILII